VVREGYDLNVPVTACGGAAGEDSVFAVDAGNIVVSTVKPAEDGSGDVIVRLYESKRMSTRCRFKTSLPVKAAALTNMLEQEPEPVTVRGGRVRLSFRPFEIKTLRLTPGK
jgi:alpha-mannosidase